jgi:hypothetical protein
MVDLGQKGWKQFTFFLLDKVKGYKIQQKIDALAISYASIFNIVFVLFL